MFIKNADTVNHTYNGQTITPSSYYEIQSHELAAWQKTSNLLIDVANEIAIVSKTNDSSGEITDVNDAIDYLKSINQIQKHQTILTQDGLTSRPWGFNFTATKNSTTTHDEKLTESLSLRGGIVETVNHEMFDEFDFQIVDVDNILGYGAGAVINDFVYRWQVSQSGKNELKDESISSTVPSNLYLRVKYKSVGTTNDVKVGFTILGYK